MVSAGDPGLIIEMPVIVCRPPSPSLSSFPGSAISREPPGSSGADTLRCSLCGEVKSSAEADGSSSGPSGRNERSPSSSSHGRGQT